jgi:diguanylate cyclase (GGDEF)-like protein/PAS domain S-box-containing protein
LRLTDRKLSDLYTHSGEFRDSSREAAFQAHRLGESRRHAQVLFILAAILNTLFLLSDWRFVGTPHFHVAIPARLTVILWSLICLGLTRHMTSFKAMERICCAWQGVTAVGVAFLVSSRSDIAIFVLVMLPLVFYLVVPTSFRGNVGGGLACSVAMLIGYLAPAPLSPTAPGMILAMLILHCGMWIAVARGNRLQRLEWMAAQATEAARVALARSGDTLERIFRAVPVPLAVTRHDGSIVRQNDAAIRFFNSAFGSEGASVRGTSRDELRARVIAGEVLNDMECQLRSADGGARDVLLSARPILVDGEDCILSSIVDITDRKAAERHLAHLAMSDPLTGLANRSHFMAGLAEAADATAQAGGMMAVVLIDVDEFKRVNDSIGHDAGDALLCAVGSRLRDTIRPADLVARMGGDEFAMLLTRLRDASDLRAIIDRVSARLREPVNHNGRAIECRVSMGVALYPDDAGDTVALMKHADLALYEAKNSGRGRACLFEPALLANWQSEQHMLDRARAALVSAPPTPWYQPKVDVTNGRVVGFEALLRCVRADGTLIMPADIAAAFEHPELGRALSARMIDAVIADCRAWTAQDLAFGHIAINIPGVDLHDGDFPDMLLRKLSAAGVAPAQIQIEVTESVFLGRHAGVVERNLHRLSEAGVSIALDDFGTGYASLSHLKQFPIDIIKIDQRFVRDIEDDPEDAAIVGAVLNLAYSLGIETVAEGVENEVQLAYLRAGGCHYAQGFHFGAAMPGADACAMIGAGVRQAS